MNSQTLQPTCTPRQKPRKLTCYTQNQKVPSSNPTPCSAWPWDQPCYESPGGLRVECLVYSAMVSFATLEHELKRLNVSIHWANNQIQLRCYYLLVFDQNADIVPGISENLVVKSKLSPRSGSSFEAVEPHP